MNTNYIFEPCINSLDYYRQFSFLKSESADLQSLTELRELLRKISILNKPKLATETLHDFLSLYLEIIKKATASLSDEFIQQVISELSSQITLFGGSVTTNNPLVEIYLFCLLREEFFVELIIESKSEDVVIEAMRFTKYTQNYLATLPPNTKEVFSSEYIEIFEFFFKGLYLAFEYFRIYGEEMQIEVVQGLLKNTLYYFEECSLIIEQIRAENTQFYELVIACSCSAEILYLGLLNEELVENSVVGENIYIDYQQLSALNFCHAETLQFVNLLFSKAKISQIYEAYGVEGSKTLIEVAYDDIFKEIVPEL